MGSCLSAVTAPNLAIAENPPASAPLPVCYVPSPPILAYMYLEGMYANVTQNVAFAWKSMFLRSITAQFPFSPTRL